MTDGPVPLVSMIGVSEYTDIVPVSSAAMREALVWSRSRAASLLLSHVRRHQGLCSPDQSEEFYFLVREGYCIKRKCSLHANTYQSRNIQSVASNLNAFEKGRSLRYLPLITVVMRQFTLITFIVVEARFLDDLIGQAPGRAIWKLDFSIVRRLSNPPSFHKYC